PKQAFRPGPRRVDHEASAYLESSAVQAVLGFHANDSRAFDKQAPRFDMVRHARSELGRRRGEGPKEPGRTLHLPVLEDGASGQSAAGDVREELQCLTPAQKARATDPASG